MTDQATTTESAKLQTNSAVNRANPVPADPADPLASVRRQCNELTSVEQIDKTTGLAILRLFHEFDRMMLELRNAKEREIDQLRHEVEGLKAYRGIAETTKQLQADVAKSLRALNEHTEDLRVVRSAVTDLSEQIREMQVRDIQRGPARRCC